MMRRPRLSMKAKRAVRLVLWIFILGIHPSVAQGKEVNIQWKPIKGAIEYELEIEHKDATPIRKMAPETSWDGRLQYGFYSYRIRAYDRLKRPGIWSEAKALVVMPNPPKIASPSPGDKLNLFDSKAPIILKWTTVDGASAYSVDAHLGGTTIFRGIVTETQALVHVPPGSEGTLSWRVAAVIKSASRNPASFSAKTWSTPAAAAEDIEVAHKTLRAPKLLGPRGILAPSRSGVMPFRWSSVNEAEAYEVRIYKDADPARGPGRIPAGTSPTIDKTFVTEDTHLDLKLPDEGVYHWEVRAVANRDDKKVAGALGPKSVTDFKLDSHAKFTDGAGYIAFSSLVAPFSYNVVSQVDGTRGRFDSSSYTMRATGEYWFTPSYGLAGLIGVNNFSVLGRNITRQEVALDAKYRINLTNSRYGWVLIPKLGLEIREYPELRPVPSSNLLFCTNYSTSGPSFGVDLRKQFSELFSLGMKASYFVPMSISENAQLSGSHNSRNLSIGAQGLYWLTQKWGFGTGIYMDWRSVSYLLNTTSANPAKQEITMDGYYFFGSVIYSFGH